MLKTCQSLLRQFNSPRKFCLPENSYVKTAYLKRCLSFTSICENKQLIFPVEDTDYPDSTEKGKIHAPDHFRHVYPEFLPDPKPEWRNRLREKLEREDMVARRNVVDIPEFFPGSIMAVTISDPNASGKKNRFVGICIERGGSGLSSWFTLRNVVENIGVEIKYDMYCPLVLSIEVLRLEKRLDDCLTYLRDCLPEFSTFPFNMEPEPLPEGAPVPVNPIKAVLKPKPWRERWERMNLKGVEEVRLKLIFSVQLQDKTRTKPWEKFDLMREYRATISEEEQNLIYRDLLPHMEKFEIARRKVKRIGLQKEK